MKAIAFVLEKGEGDRKSRYSLVKSVCVYTKLHSNQTVADPLSMCNAI